MPSVAVNGHHLAAALSVFLAADDKSALDVWLGRAGQMLALASPFVGLLVAAAKRLGAKIDALGEKVQATATQVTSLGEDLTETTKTVAGIQGDLADAIQDLAQVKGQLQNNGGRSLRDVTDRIERTLGGLAGQVQGAVSDIARLGGRFDEFTRRNGTNPT